MTFRSVCLCGRKNPPSLPTKSHRETCITPASIWTPSTLDPEPPVGAWVYKNAPICRAPLRERGNQQDHPKSFFLVDKIQSIYVRQGSAMPYFIILYSTHHAYFILKTARSPSSSPKIDSAKTTLSRGKTTI